MADFSSKPLGIKNYGHIPHLPGSRIGPGDHRCDEGQARIATEAPRDRHDLVIVLEKLDGSNVGVARLNGALYPLNRSGYLATSSPYVQHQLFAAWVYENQDRSRRSPSRWAAQHRSRDGSSRRRRVSRRA